MQTFRLCHDLCRMCPRKEHKKYPAEKLIGCICCRLGFLGHRVCHCLWDRQFYRYHLYRNDQFSSIQFEGLCILVLSICLFCHDINDCGRHIGRTISNGSLFPIFHRTDCFCLSRRGPCCLVHPWVFEPEERTCITGEWCNRFLR